MPRLPLALLALLAALPAAAQERGGVHMRDPTLVLNQIDANRGCPLSATSVTVGVNKATGFGSAANQQLATQNAPFGSSLGSPLGNPTGAPLGSSGGCRPLVSTQVVAGVNLALGGRSSAGQSIDAQGPRGVLATTTFTRGANIGFGAQSSATQRLSNLTR